MLRINMVSILVCRAETVKGAIWSGPAVSLNISVSPACSKKTFGVFISHELVYM